MLEWREARRFIFFPDSLKGMEAASRGLRFLIWHYFSFMELHFLCESDLRDDLCTDCKTASVLSSLLHDHTVC